MGKGLVHVGTSGWSYRHWKGVFYPEDLPEREFLRHYAGLFRTVEVNNSFYRLPGRDDFFSWKRDTPDGFVFSVKASRYITHMKKLKDPFESVKKFVGRAECLGEKLGPLLFQLPPRWGCDPERLEAFLDILPDSHRYAFEFRDPSWFNREVYSLLERKGAAFCMYQFEGMLSPKEITAEFAYIRLHGPSGKAYRGSYDASELAGWTGAISSWSGMGKDIYCYFDNDEKGYAAKDAIALGEMVAG